MKMQPGKADDEFVWEQLRDFFQKAHNDASFEILASIAKHVGIGQLNGFPIDEFFERRKGEIAEELVADFADTFPTLASEVKDAWEELEALAPERFPGCSSVRPCLRASPSHHPRLPSIGQDGSRFAKGPKRNVCLW